MPALVTGAFTLLVVAILIGFSASQAAASHGGFADFGFKNQGRCIRFANTGKDSR